MNICSICGLNYTKNSNSQKYCIICHKSKKKEWAKKCYDRYRNEYKAKSNKYYYEHREKIKEKMKITRQSLEYKKKAYNLYKKWAIKNQEKIKALRKKYKHTEKGKLTTRILKERYREKRAGIGDKRRNRLNAYFVKIIFNAFDNKCFKCEGMFDLTIDHNKCLSTGNGLSYTNSVILCRKCNGAKGDKSPEEFYTSEELTTLNRKFNILAAIEKGGNAVAEIEKIELR